MGIVLQDENITTSTSGLIAIGRPFFENFVTVIDYEANNFNFSLSKDAQDGARIIVQNHYSSSVYIFLWVLFALIAIFVIIVIVRCVKGRNER